LETSGLFATVSIIVQLIFLEGILSIDNAAVLGAMVSILPDDKPVPYPHSMKFLQRFTDRFWGMQQMAALKVGLLGAYVGRGGMLVLAAWVVANPSLRILGALYLIKLAFDNLSTSSNDKEKKTEIYQQQQETSVFWLVVLNVELADLAFSLDNVVAAVALSRELWIVMVGVALGILIMRFAAGIFTWMIKREPVLATAAYIVVLNIGVELLLAEFMHIHIDAWLKFIISVGTIVLCVAYARFSFLQPLAPIFRWIAVGIGRVNKALNWILQPLSFLGKLARQWLKKLVPPLLRYNTHPTPSHKPNHPHNP